MDYITKKHLSRRTVLRGLGVTMALPLLDAMIPAHTLLAKTAAGRGTPCAASQSVRGSSTVAKSSARKRGIQTTRRCQRMKMATAARAITARIRHE